MIDTSAMNLEIRQRARALVTELNYDDIADNLPEQLSKVTTTPALYVMIRRVSGSELTPGLRPQKQELEVLVGIVVQSMAGTSAALKGANALDIVAGKVMQSLHFWKPTLALERIKFRGEDEPVRDGSRIGVQQRYASSIHETFN